MAEQTFVTFLLLAKTNKLGQLDVKYRRFFKDNQDLRIIVHNLTPPSTTVLPRYFLYT